MDDKTTPSKSLVSITFFYATILILGLHLIFRNALVFCFFQVKPVHICLNFMSGRNFLFAGSKQTLSHDYFVNFEAPVIISLITTKLSGMHNRGNACVCACT